MKPFSLIVMVVCSALTVSYGADDPKKEEKKPKPVNAICPVSDHDVEADVTVTHNKKLIGFCCEDCVKDFQKSPAKYMKKVEAEEAKNKKAAEKKGDKKGEQPAADKTKPVNKFCPIEPEHAVDATVATTTHNGKVVGFCCEDCIKKFDLDPDAYTAGLN
jgi:YHS domain-containing protein